MSNQPAPISYDLATLPKLPGWVTSGCAETIETVAFRSGTALIVLDALISDPRHGVPIMLSANRLALTAATATSKLEGRVARKVDIRDAYHLTSPGEARGPDGDLLEFWREGVRLQLVGKGWQEALVDLIGYDMKAEVDDWIRAGEARSQTHGPLAGCVAILRAVLEVDDRAERIACLLADIVIARSLNWKTILPLSAHGLSKAMLRELTADGQGADLAIQASLLNSIEDSIHLASDLASRAAALRAVAPKLRAKGSDAAVALFLSEDAVGPSTMLSPMIQGTTIPMTGRAARRFCDRLVELGVACELTGRSTFRLYAIAP